MNQRKSSSFRSSKRSRRQLGIRAQPLSQGKTSRASGHAVRSDDPFRERESARYAEPVPSREYILQVLGDRGVPVSEDELERALGVTEDERTAFHRRLGAMEREGEIMRNRRNAICVVDKLDLVRGRIHGHPDGFGFLIRDDGGPDLFLEPKEMLKALHGDRVMARQSGVDRRGRPEGKIVEDDPITTPDLASALGPLLAPATA